MTPLKARIFGLLRRAGSDGIAGDDLFAIVYDGQLPRYHGGHKDYSESSARSALKANIWQLNKLIVADGYRIDGRGGCYRLQRRADGVEA
jgi:hypothetical protein